MSKLEADWVESLHSICDFIAPAGLERRSNFYGPFAGSLVVALWQAMSQNPFRYLRH